MVVLAVENSAADIISARIFIRTGTLWESPQEAGISHLFASVLTKGTEQFSSLEIAERIECTGAGLGADASSDYFLLSLKTVSPDFPEMLDLAGHILRSPTFPENEVDLERRLTLQAIRSQQEQPFTIALDQLRQSIYREHPYALSGLGTIETVSRLTRKDLQHYHQTYFRPDNVIVSIAGRITPEAAIALVDQVFGNWQIPAEPLSPPSMPRLTYDPQVTTTVQDTKQAIVMLGYPVPSVHSPDYGALKLLNTYLGNGLSSRLFVELREKRGLAYEVSAFYPTRLEASHFVAYMGTAAENTSVALDGLKAEIDRLWTAQLSSGELEAAKNKLLGQYALGKQTNAQIAQTAGWYELLGLGVEFDAQFRNLVTAVTPEEAQAVASRHFSMPYISLVGPAVALGVPE
ncbi:peptidase M16 [Leptolyngbya sp. 'hensonii']|nr:peptidase M16 [Leptolyngbya sp. 'hensonii']